MPEPPTDAAVDPLAEIEAMRRVADAIKSLPDTSQRRVLEWASEFFGAQPLADSRAVRNQPLRPQNSSERELSADSGLEDLPSFFSAASPSTEAERALVVGYWLQKREGQEEFDSFRVNSELKHLGYRVGNITQALGALMKSKPQQVVQTRKEGKSRQARKKYKLTVEGLRRAEQMLGRQGDFEV